MKRTFWLSTLFFAMLALAYLLLDLLLILSAFGGSAILSTLFLKSLTVLRFLSLTSILGVIMGKRREVSPWLLLLSSAVIDYLSSFLRLFLRALLSLGDLELTDLLSTLLGTLEGTLLPLLLALLLSELLFLRSKDRTVPKEFFPSFTPFSKAAFASVWLIALRFLISQTISTVETVNRYYGILTPGETVSIILDYLLLLALPIVAYPLTLLVAEK